MRLLLVLATAAMFFHFGLTVGSLMAFGVGALALSVVRKARA